MNTIAITGAAGQLGSELCQLLGSAAAPLSRANFDLRDQQAMKQTLEQMNPAAVVNAAAYTQVDRAEQEAELCREVNDKAVGVLSDICNHLRIPLVQVSTDYVFGSVGECRPQRESDPVEPLGVYAKTKAMGEQQAARCERHFIVRTCGLYAAPDKEPIRGRNFVDTMLSLGAERDHLRIVADQHCTPTYVPQLARAIQFLLSTDQYGTYHVTNSGATTWFDFASAIFANAGLQVELEPITTEEYGAPAPRPRYSVLDTTKYHALGGPEMSPWQTALQEYLDARHQ